MKKFNYLFSIALAIVVSFAFVSCSDDEEFDPQKELNDGMTAYRAFILSEGSYGNNNSHLVYVNPNTLTAVSTDIYESVNGQKIGDTAQGMIEYDGDIYYVVNGSQYVVRLDASCKELCRYSTTEEQGQPRYVVAHDGKIYVTTYGGYILRLDAKTLSYEASVTTDPNPEQIVYQDGYLYTVCSGYGNGNTMTKVNLKSFSNPESITVLNDPMYISETDGHLFIIGYDENWVGYVSDYDVETGEITKIADAAHMAVVDGKLYYSNSTCTDYVTYTYSTTYNIYDPATKKISSWNLNASAMPSSEQTKVVYMIAYNSIDDTFYIATSDYYTNGTVSVFDRSGAYLGNFSAGGVNPNSMVFLETE